MHPELILDIAIAALGVAVWVVTFVGARHAHVGRC